MLKPWSWSMTLNCGKCRKTFTNTYKDLTRIGVLEDVYEKLIILMETKCPNCGAINSMEFKPRSEVKSI